MINKFMNKLTPYIICLIIAVIFFFAGAMFNQNKISAIAEDTSGQNETSSVEDAKILADENLIKTNIDNGRWMVGKIVSIKDQELLIQNIVDKKDIKIITDENTAVTFKIIGENGVSQKPAALKDLKVGDIMDFLLKDLYAKEIVGTVGQSGGAHQNK